MARSGYIKVALFPVLMWATFAVGFYLDHQMGAVCPACRHSTTYLLMRILSGMGILLPSLVAAHYLVDKWCERD
jgi:type III secretory pathway component EscT